MAIAFNNVKRGIGMLDKIPNGKFANCRPVDIIPENFDYVLWVHRKGYITFTLEVLTAAETAQFNNDAERYFDEEVAPYFDDIPF